MSGDVQPRKRKDKKRKKDELGVEEPRGTAAVFGEGDVFIHTYQDHGTGGHWCAKVIFFSLLAVLLTLIGLIILENRGLSELEANAVESRYSGVLEGWLEDAPDDDHHDEHTLELKHHDDDDDDHDEAIDHDDDEHDEDSHDHDEQDSEQDHEDEEDDEGHDHDDEEHDDDNQTEEDENEQDDEEQDLEAADEDEDEEHSYNKYYGADDEEHDDENEYEKEVGEDEVNDETENQSEEQNDDDGDGDDDDEKNRNYEDDERENEDEEEHEDEEEDEEVEVERIEKEVSEEEPISLELPALPEDDDDDDDDKQDDNEENEDEGQEEDDDDEDFLEADDEPPIVERITAPAGKPFVEVEEEVSSEQPPDTLEEEEDYEKQQEELRREEEQASHMWLKLVVGGALLVATHALVRRATATPPRDEPEQEERVTREETPVIDRRMTLIPEESSQPVAPKKFYQEIAKPIVEEVAKKVTSSVKSSLPNQESEEEPEEPEEIEEEIEELKKDDEEKELYSDEEEPEEEEEEDIIQVKKELPKQSAPVETNKDIPKPKTPEPEPVDEVPDDVEIIDEEQLEEELEEEDEEEISDVDDVELLSRLEAKYGRLPEPERPGQKYKDGGNSLEDEWPGEPSDAFWRQELDSAERDLRQASAPALGGSARARWVVARALDRDAEARRDNALLSRAVAAYIHLLKMNERLSDEKLLQITNRTLDRIQFRGNYLSAEPIYRLLIRRFPNEPAYRNNLTISFLMANRADLAEEALKETLRLWPDNRLALAHYAFVLKTQHNRLEEAVNAFQKALEGDKGPACEPRFYYHLGDALLLLGRFKEAHVVHQRAAKLGHFLSPAQRSLYNVDRLKSQPWWNVEQTPYAKLAHSLEKSWRDILKEAEAARALYEMEKEGLKERGEWSQMDLFVRGREVPDRCKRAPVTCSIVRAVGCRRGQVKFSAMEPGTHVRPHVGPTNCRLRMHLGLSNTKDTYIRVDKEIRQWEEGKVLMFDDSFEHEVWHNGTGRRLVLIVDVWHPDLTPAETRALPAI